MQHLPKRPRRNARRRRQSSSTRRHRARITKRQSSSMVSNTPRTTLPSTRTATSAPSPAARASQLLRIAASPRPSSQSRALAVQASDSARNSVSASACGAERGERGGGIGQALGMRDDIDADADRQRVAAAVELLRIRAGCRQAWRRRRARRSAISARSGRDPARRCRSTPMPILPFGTTAASASDSASPATKPSVAASFSSPRPTSSSVAARLPCGVSQLRPRRPRPLSWRFDTIHSLPGSPSSRALERQLIGGADRLVRFEPVSVEDGGRRQFKAHQKNVLAAASRHLRRSDRRSRAT